MNIEREERLILRFTPQEAAALLKLMGLEELPGLSVWAEYPQKETVERLVRSGVVTPCGEKTLVDRTVSWVLRTAAQSARHLAAVHGETGAALYVGERFCVLTEKTNTAIVRMEPIQNLTAAQPLWENAVRRLGNPLALTLAANAAVQTFAGDARAAMALTERLKDSEVE